jgi:diketogulonate reductase-like aldo/keto reductase
VQHGVTMTRERVVQGVRVPSMLYGTAWKEDRTASLTERALDAGFTGIDTANQRRHYVETAVGEAVSASVARGKIAREDLFLQTKFTFAGGQDVRIPYDPRASYAAQVRQSFESSLEHLTTTYIDSLLLHGPSRREGLGKSDREVWLAMEALHQEGRVRLLGVSNVSLRQLEELHRDSAVKPAVVQNRTYADQGWGREIRAFCRANGMAYQGFSLLTANRRALEQPTVRRIAARTGKSTAQVILRFALQVGMIPLTGTTSAAHMREDLACFDFELEDGEVQAIEAVAG